MDTHPRCSSGPLPPDAVPSTDANDLDIEVQRAPRAVRRKRGKALETRSCEARPVAQTQAVAAGGGPVPSALERALEVEGQDLHADFIKGQSDFRFDPAILIQAGGDLGGVYGRGGRAGPQGVRNDVGAGFDKDDGEDGGSVENAGSHFNPVLPRCVARRGMRPLRSPRPGGGAGRWSARARGRPPGFEA